MIYLLNKFIFKEYCLIIFKNERDKDNFVFNVKTVQSGAFRVLIESLKEILTDTNIIFDKTGIKIIATDSCK